VAIEFKHSGRVWRADTPEEAIALRERLEARSRDDAKEGVDQEEGVWTPDTALELLEGIGNKQKEFLRFLFEHTEVSDVQVVKELKLTSPLSLAGVLSGLSKQAKKQDIKPWHLYVTTVEWDGKDKSRSFYLGRGFRLAAEEIGWPDKWV
jgi:hypothetical protein